MEEKTVNIQCLFLSKSLWIPFVLHGDDAHTVNLCELLAVQRGQQFPLSRKGGDEVYGERHGGMAADISADRTGNDFSNHKSQGNESFKNRQYKVYIFSFTHN